MLYINNSKNKKNKVLYFMILSSKYFLLLIQNSRHIKILCAHDFEFFDDEFPIGAFQRNLEIAYILEIDKYPAKAIY